MALLPTLPVPGEEHLTPDQVERLRQSSGLAAQRGADTSPVAHWSAGLARLVDAYGGYRGSIRAGQQESKGLERYQDWQGRLGTAQAGLSPVVDALSQGIGQQAGGSSGNFPASLIETESGGNWNALNNEMGAGGRGHGGRLQFGHARLQDAANAGVIPSMTPQQFAQQPPEVQQAVENWHFADIDRQAERMGLNSFVGQEVGGVPITQDAIRGMAHLGGIGGAAKFLQSGGTYNPSDSFGTSLRDYGIRHGGGQAAVGGQGGMAQAGIPQGGMNSEVAALLAEGMADPWIRQQGGPVIEALMQQQMRQSDPMYQAQLQNQQLQNQALMNPAAPKPVYEGGQWWDIGSGQPQALTEAVPDQTSAMQNYEYLIGQGMDPASAVERAFGGGVNVAVNNRTDPAPATGYRNVYDEAGNLISQEPIPGGPAALEMEAAAAAREGMQGLTARQLNPTIDDITTARDLAENGIGTTGMFSGMIQRIPGVGQDSVDMAATIDAIGSGISLESLNQMRQNSPTGGALGNVSDKQSALLSEAFGSLRQSMSKDQFLYNLARVENTLNDIVHGEGNGPERHDMETLRRKLRGEDFNPRMAEPSGSVAAPMSREQYDALPSGARFQAPDGSVRIKP